MKNVVMRLAGFGLLIAGAGLLAAAAQTSLAAAKQKAGSQASEPDAADAAAPPARAERRPGELGEVDFGEVYPSGVFKGTLEWFNASEAPFVVSSVGTECGCVQVEEHSEVAEPGEVLRMSLVFDPGISSARQVYKRVHVIAEDGRFMWGYARAVVVTPPGFESPDLRHSLRGSEETWEVETRFSAPPGWEEWIELENRPEDVEVQLGQLQEEAHQKSMTVRVRGKLDPQALGRSVFLSFRSSETGEAFPLEVELVRILGAAVQPSTLYVEAGAPSTALIHFRNVSGGSCDLRDLELHAVPPGAEDETHHLDFEWQPLERAGDYSLSLPSLEAPGAYVLNLRGSRDEAAPLTILVHGEIHERILSGAAHTTAE